MENRVLQTVAVLLLLVGLAAGALFTAIAASYGRLDLRFALLVLGAEAGVATVAARLWHGQRWALVAALALALSVASLVLDIRLRAGFLLAAVALVGVGVRHWRRLRPGL